MSRKKKENNKDLEDHFDLTEESSKRSEGPTATTIARMAENDDANEEMNIGNVNDPGDDFEGENRIATSISDD